MGMEKRECKARNGLIVNTSTLNCPSSCDECPEYQLIRKERRYRESQERKSKQQPLICFSRFLHLAYPLYDFLQSIPKINEKELYETLHNLQQVRQFLEENYLLISVDQINKDIEHLEDLAFIVFLYRTCIKQKKNIALDCFLVFLNTVCDMKPSEIWRYVKFYHEELLSDRCDQEDEENKQRTFYKLLSDAKKNLHLYKIINKAIPILPDFYFNPQKYL